ncbi:MAG: HAMP domain-containing sensor histidine kinase [Bacteroidota bacterium]|nr:HAMP domain-containing sensor histidine kinase [Bacteroidota bacterium]
MKAYNHKTYFKLFLLICAILIGMGSLWYTNKLTQELKIEEQKKVELWAAAMQQLVDLDDPEENIAFLFQIIEGNNTVPLILMDEVGDTISTRNLNKSKLDNKNYLERQLKLMKAEHDPIEIIISEDRSDFMYYKSSLLLTKLKYFPYVQLGLIIFFVFVAYLAFNSSRKFEQNQVWVGLTKEAAHQLGTPTSSLTGWVDVMKMKKFDQDLVREFEKDVKRLEKITERFSRVGSTPKLVQTNIIPILFNTVDYLESRLSDQVRFKFNFKKNDDQTLSLNTTLFEWVIENLLKNAIDAMRGKGFVEIYLTVLSHNIYIDIKDSGKGIPKSKFKAIFKPGYTTKDRGWGLGLSLSRRIIEEYHKGELFVENSELNKGSCIRIVLNKS